MSAAIDLDRVTFIVLREMRRPVMALIAVYSFSILGMVFIPGMEVNGETQYMSIFHAFYFMTYTATTTGFGEIPFEFSNAQRFWAIACLYVSVVTWFYAVGSIIRLIQNPFFLRALEEAKFSRSVLRISGQFIIICGFGDTGSVLTRGLTDAGLSVVVIDMDKERIQALKLRNYPLHVPGLCADASVPKHLLEAGVRNNLCKSVVAISNDEEANLKISAMARLLNPGVGIITMSKIEVFEETLITLGGEVHIVDPFKTFSKVLAASLNHPGFYALNNWLVREKGTSLDKIISPPRGDWIICGYGRMGHEMDRMLATNNIKTTVIDPHERIGDEYADRYIVGRTTSKTLEKARVDRAVGILAVTDDDGHNLGILLNARYYNKNLFTIVRQNRHLNEVAFNAADVDMVMQPSLVTARRILFLVIAPLLKQFFRYLLDQSPDSENAMKDLISRLVKTVGNKKPLLVTIDFTEETSKSVIRRLRTGNDVYLGELLKDPDNRDRPLEMVVFVIKSGEEIIILPKAEYKVKENDQMLFCGTELASRLLNATINSEYKLFYVQHGKFMPRSWLAQWYVKKTNRIGV